MNIMRILVDEMPDYKDECPFFVYCCYVNGATTIKNYCRLTKEVCDLSSKTGCRTTCSGLTTITNDRVVQYD